MVLKPKFGIVDFWFRYEFQGRGSTHVHGFAWIDMTAAPELDVNTGDMASRQAYTSFWAHHVYAVNPEPNRQAPARRSRGVYNTSADELQNSVAHLSDVVNRTQVHACSEAYCQRRRKGAPDNAPKTCRFYFPRVTGPAVMTKDVRYSFLERVCRSRKKMLTLLTAKPELLDFCRRIQRLNDEPIQSYRSIGVARQY